MKCARQYSLAKIIWKPHSQLLQASQPSSAVIFNHVMYNVGGWDHLTLLEALLVKNWIVHFGWFEKYATYLFEKEEEPEELKIVREGQATD